MLKNKFKKLGMIQKLELKLVGLVMISILAILLVIGFIICYGSYRANTIKIEQELITANEQASKTYFSYIQENYKVPEFESVPESFFNQSKPIPDNEDSFSMRRPNIGKRENDPGTEFPVATYYLNKGSLIEIPNMQMTAYLSSATLAKLAAVTQDAHEGISLNEECKVVFSKTTIKGISFLAFTDISYYYSWTGTLNIVILLAIPTLLLFLVVGIIFAKWASKPIKEAWESQERFVEDASHDLKTPLTVILANTSILKTNPQKTIEEQSAWIDSIQEESERMTGLINNMLDLANIDEFAKTKHRKKKNLNPVDFSNIVQAQCLQVEAIAFDKQLDFITKIPENIFIYGSKDDITKIVSSIISNSCKHAPLQDTISVSLSANKNIATLSVNNKLSIIGTEDLPHVFDRFYRSDKSRSRDNAPAKEQSHGLGLAIAKSLTEQLNGSLDVTSDTSNGTTFIAKFPLAKMQDLNK